MPRSIASPGATPRPAGALTTERSAPPLPVTVTYSQPCEAGLSNRRFYALCDAGEIEQRGRGLFRQADGDLVDLDLDEALARAPDATLCLMSALSLGLTTALHASAVTY